MTTKPHQPDQLRPAEESRELNARRAVALLLFLLLVLAWAGTVSLLQDDDSLDDPLGSTDAILAVAWPARALFSVSCLLVLGMSIFVRLIVYLGGRYERKRFYDRIIDPIMVPAGNAIATALFGAVFVCLFISSLKDHQIDPPGYSWGFGLHRQPSCGG